MSDSYEDVQRKLRALSLAEAEALYSHAVRLIERDRYVMELLGSGEYYATALSHPMARHRTHVERIKREWPNRLERWPAKRAKLAAQIVALGGTDPTV